MAEPLATRDTLAIPVEVPIPPTPVPEGLREGLGERVPQAPPPDVPVAKMGGLSVREAELKGDTDTLPVGLPVKDTLGV